MNFKDFDISKINKENLRIDVGLSHDAPHSAYWLEKYEDITVVGIEPNPENIDGLHRGRAEPSSFSCLRLNDSAIVRNGKKRKNFDKNNFLLVEAAIDDVSLPTTQTFYCTGGSTGAGGCSSLLVPNEESLGLNITEEVEVETFSLEYFLDSLGLEDIEKIMFVKTDTQGKDLDVVKSLGKYLHKVAAFKCERYTGDQYMNTPPEEDLINFMVHHKFYIDNGYSLSPEGATIYDIFCFNSRFFSWPDDRKKVQDLFDLPRGV